MFDFMNKLGGSVTILVTGTHTEKLLNMCAAAGVELMSVTPSGEYSRRVVIPCRQLKSVQTMAGRSLCRVEVEKTEGAAAAGMSLRRRVFPVVLFVLLISIIFWSKAYIWEIEVTGNENVSTGEILAALKDCGVEEGSYWPAFSSDNIRSQALTRLPELLWLTVNVHGSHAEVVVRERTPKPEMIDIKNPVDIISTKDAFITQVRALYGSAEVKEGQAVQKGELLISGAVESITGSVRTVHSYGEIIGQTYYELTAAYPITEQKKEYTGREEQRWALEFWGKRVNFYRNSSIYTESCDKIYSEYSIELKGLFSLPVSLVRETCLYYEKTENTADIRLVKIRLEQLLYERLLEELGEGHIISDSCSFTQSNGMIIASLKAHCEESIGVTVPLDETRVRQFTQLNTGEGMS